MTDWYVGTMGFSYKQWRGAFYPEGMAARDYLGHYSQFFNAVEMDSTFYATPPASNVARWTAVTPPSFKFCPKVPRQITHDLRLVNAGEPMETFLETMDFFGRQLGPILLQFPPDFTNGAQETLDAFLSTLPTDVRLAVEFRHRSWHTARTAELLQKHNACWVAADYIYLPKEIRRTADFLYLRFLGRHGRFQAKDREQVDKTAELQQWKARLQPHLEHVSDVYAFFNDDYAGHSPASATRFKRILGLEAKETRPPQQGRLF